MRTKLNNILHNLKPLNEVKIFTAMASILNGIPKTNAVFVKKTHGRAGWVSFSTHNQVIMKEIADILMVIYNRKKNEVRISFLQAKYKKDSIIKPFLEIPGVDYYQWDLLKRRCDIKSQGYIQFPDDILSFTNYKSITSYGIFYWNNNQIDMLYSIPDFFCSTNQSPKGKRPTTTLSLTCLKNGPIPKRYTATCHINSPCQPCSYGLCCFPERKDEVLSTCDIDVYERFLLNGYIGAPINNINNIEPFIRSLLANFNSDAKDETIKEICGFLGVKDPIADSAKDKGLSINILAIVTNGLED